ncbi:replication/transcription [Electric ant rhabdovirus]|uniref:RNA-directed RNA polymerase L n=1 Tax=Electric ant rhabdovirus TaxID=3014874 RepID=A0AA95J282_9RHAB|nr:replication/transcription [Electric ant rhabdovirus]
MIMIFMVNLLHPPLATHCDVPLKYNKQRAAINKPGIGQYSKSRNQYYYEYLNIQKILGPLKPDYFDVCHIQQYLLNDFEPERSVQVLVEWEQQNRVSRDLWMSETQAIQELIPNKDLFLDYKLTPDQLDLLQPYYLRRVLFEELILSSGSDNYTPNYWIEKKDNVSFYSNFHLQIACTKNLCVIKFKELTFLVSRDHLLMLSDLAAQRYLLLRYAFLSTLNSKNHFIPPGMLIEYFISGDLVLKHGGNDSYQIVYKTEPLCLSYLIGDIPLGNPQGKTFKTMILQDIHKVATSLNLINETNRLISIVNLAASSSPTYLSELYGLYRIWGHPTLEPLEGTAALKKIVTPVRITDTKLSIEISNKFKEEFICRYINKEHIWPSINVDKLPVSNIIRSAYENKAPYPNKHRKYDRKDLSLITFNQLFPIDPKFDLIELIADKALSLITPELIHKILTQHNCGSANERSVLINWLKSPIQDPETFLRLIDKTGFPSMEKSFGLREKEREGKLKARLFGLMTLFKRMYIVLTEALLAEHVIPFFPEITMIDDELSLDKKRYQFTLKKKFEQFIISLDFSKWNSNMRKNETLPLFKTLDEMFDFLNCFQRTHEMFEGSAAYLLNGTYLPTIDSEGKLKPDIGCWYGHLGGIEGLRQKGWTIWTVSLILLAAEDLPFKLMLLGQGDNQILKLSFPLNFSESDALEFVYKFLNNLDVILGKIGPPLKLEETWTSKDLFVYGKYIIYKGTPLPTSGKRIARMFRLSNEDYPTIESAISSATANLTAALSCNINIGPLFILYLSEIVGIFQLGLRSKYLQRDEIRKIFSKSQFITIPGEYQQKFEVNPITNESGIQDDLLYKALCITPRALGGFPVSTLFDCAIRGFPDEVSFAIASLRKIYPYCDKNLRMIINRVCSPPINTLVNYQLISEHPTALNLEIPPAPGEARRNLIINFLKEQHLPLNPYVQTFLNLLESEEDKNLMEYISNIEPFNPRIISLFMAATVESRARHVAGKLQKTKTIANVARTIGHVDLFSKISDAEINHIGSVFRIISEDHHHTVSWNHHKCSVKHADELRKFGWKKDVIGVNCVPPQEFMILELSLEEFECTPSNELDKGYMTIRFDPHYELEGFNSPLNIGPYPPYRGSVTRQKVSGYGDKIASQAEPILQRVLRLFSLVGWGIPKDGHLHTVCKKLLEARTDLNPDILFPTDEEITGSVHHRLQDLRTGHGGSVTILPNYGSKLMFDTFPLKAYSKGSKNVNLMFQSFMSFSTVLIGELISRGWTPGKPTVHMHVRKSCCVQELEDSTCDISAPPDTIVLSKFPDNPYLFVKKEKIDLLIKKGIRFEVNPNLAQDKENLFYRFHALLSEECFHILQPHSWDRPTYNFGTHQLVINWVLPCNISYLLILLAFRICGHYIGAIRESDKNSFLTRVAERVSRSPLENWTKLSALIFAPQVHHHLAGKTINSRVSGNPVCTETRFAATLRNSISTIISSWVDPTITQQTMNTIIIYGRPFCGLSQHPALLELTKNWLLSKLKIGSLKSLRHYLMDSLTSVTVQSISPALTKTGNTYLKIGKKRITNENLDSMCKNPKLFQIPSIAKNSKSTELPTGGFNFAEFTIHDLHNSLIEVSNDPFETPNPKYSDHLLKIASTPTTGSYKCLSILRELSIYPPNMIGCFGDGSGGFTLANLLYYKECEVFFNTLIEHEVPIQQSSPIPFIPALSGYPSLEHRVVGLNLTNEFESDITSPRLGKLIRKQISNSFDLIFCDAEFAREDPLSKGLNLIHGIIRICKSLQSPTLVFKTYCKNISLLIYQISLILNNFNSVKIFRSYFSSESNTEIYLICHQPIKSTSLNLLHESKWQGNVLNIKAQEVLYRIRESLCNSKTLLKEPTSKEYTQFLDKDYQSHGVFDLKQYLPFIEIGSIIIYPQTISQWILNTSSKIPGEPEIIRLRLETFTLHHSYIKRWIIMHLITLILSSVDFWVQCLEEKIKTGYFIWFKTRNKLWDISLYFAPIPYKADTKYLRFYKLSEFVESGDLKIIFKMVGLALNLNIQCHNINSGPLLEIRGQSHLKPLQEENYAMDPWVKDNCQFGSGLSQIPLHKTMKEKFSQSKVRKTRKT